ncbi:hypothetical protein Aperf_G00000069773 [Anoplocephala perfoliata]
MPNSSSSGSTASNAIKPSRGKRENISPGPHQVEYELSKDGELVPVSNESDAANDLKLFQEQSLDQRIESKASLESCCTSSRNKRKQTFERKNIKRVRDDCTLSEEAQTAQKAEMERRLRLKIEEKAHLQKTAQWDISSSLSHFIPNSEGNSLQTKPDADIKPNFGNSDAKPVVLPSATTASEKLFKQKHPQSLQPDDTIIVIGESDDEIDFNINGPDLKLSNHQVIELSDDEDADVVMTAVKEVDADDGKDEEEVETEFCELRDAQNLPDAEGRICIRRAATEDKSCYLAPHIARIIKPHQVSGVRFLFENLVENQTEFNRSEGFGCILAHSMGLGKSIQVIAFLDLVFRYYPALHTVLLIVPINTLQNWQSEFQMWLPSTLYSPEGETKPKMNGQQPSTAASAPASMAMPSSHQLISMAPPPPPPVVHSEPSLLSLINDSPPPPPSNITEQGDHLLNTDPVLSGEPQFPPPPPTASPSVSPQVEPIKVEEPVREPPSFRLHVIKDTTKSLDARYQVVSEWTKVGGVLLMGYEMFRMLTSPKKQTRVNSAPSMNAFIYSGGGGIGNIPLSVTANSLFQPPPPPPFLSDMDKPSSRKRRRPVMIDIEKEEKEEHMLKDMRIALADPGPQIVICDEGHRIKNSEASISRALKAIRTKRRVVLTGYPLQNNLMEYWCMVDFVRPNYLGSKAEFTNMFQRPIENGQCVDSTEADRKLMQGRAHVLHGLLSGFVQRRSHAVLKASLPPKQEVVLMVRMSPLQRRLYTALMNHIANTSNTYGSGLPTANTLQTYALCCKIWNHPDILWRVVQENVDEALDFELDDTSNTANGIANPRAKRKTNGSNSVTPGGTGSSSNDDKYAWLTSDLWGDDFRVADVRNSGKLLLFLSLLWESVRAGDKMLLFSQSLLTLDLIERLLGRLPLDSERPPSPSQIQASQEQLQQQRLEEEEETEKTLHYRFNRRMGNDPSKQPQVWVRNVHYFRLDGSTSATDRDRLIRRFNDHANPVKLFLVSTRAGSLGVNLFGANRVVVFDASWNPCHDCQAVCRVYRYGQEKPCYIYRLVSDNTMERKIYDRQINKQGVSDRVVDEMNPGQQFTRAQVGVLMAYEDKDMPTISDEDLLSISDLTDSDSVLKATLARNKEWITTKPFTHESLLIDRKDYRLTRVEKRIAYQRYQQERINSANVHGNTRSMSALHYQMMAAAASGVPFSPYGATLPMGFNYASQGRGMPNILSKSGGGINAAYHGAYGGFASTETPPYVLFPPSAMEDRVIAARRYDGIQRNRMLQKDLDEARIRAVSREIGITLPNGPLGNDYKITRVAASTDLVFPQSTHPPAPERSIPKGEIVEIIQAGPNGRYLRLPRTGDIYVVKPGSSSKDSSGESKSDNNVAGNTGTQQHQQQQQQQQQKQTQPPPPPPLPPQQVQMQNQTSEDVPQVSAAHPAPLQQPPLCPRCRHPTVPGCLCSSMYSNQPPPRPPPPIVSSNASTQMSFHSPTYTNQYALPSAVVPSPYVSPPPPPPQPSSTNTPTNASAPHGYSNY